MTAAELAEELEVSVRTVYRDLEALGAAGVPLYAERGVRGGYRLLDGYRTTLTGLSADEAEALFLTGLPGPAAELGLATAVAAARRKVMAALPERLREAAQVAQQRFHLDPAQWFRKPPEHPHLETIASAVWGSSAIARSSSAIAPGTS
jgi:predicted DNA-binding transcriptional regulator YafY